VDKVQLGERTEIRIGRIRKRPRQELNWVTYVQCTANTRSLGNEEWVIKMAKHFWARIDDESPWSAEVNMKGLPTVILSASEA